MTRRDCLLKAVLVTGALATVATSAPRGPLLSAEGQLEVTGPEVVHLTVTANAEAAFQSSDLIVEFFVDGVGGPNVIVPDDPNLPTVTLTRGFGNIQLGSYCASPDPEPCSVGFSVDVGGNGDGIVTVDASLRASSDSSDDAALRVDFD